jgi:type IV pilus assembly protein PilV
MNTLTYQHQLGRKRQTAGFTLLEILVAIVVLSFGLLGMVGIQAMALKSNNDAKQQAAAVQLAAEYSDMMRGNKAVAMGLTAVDNPYLIDNYVSSPVTPAPENCSQFACSTASRIAEWEKADWLTRINTDFPEARVVVCYDQKPYTDTGSKGIPQWPCTGTPIAGMPISIKIGWTRATTNSNRSSSSPSAFDKATDTAGRPSVIYSVTPGSSS